MKKADNKIGAPFCPITEIDARRWYVLKYLNTAGYLLVIKRILAPPGADFTIPNVTKFCKEWSIPKSSFYKAINSLVANNDICWEATEGVIIKASQTVIPIVSSDGLNPPTDEFSNLGQVSQVETVVQNQDEISQILDTVVQSRDENSLILDTDIYIDRARNQSNTEIYKERQSVRTPAPTTPKLETKSLVFEVPKTQTKVSEINQFSGNNSNSSVEVIIPLRQVEVVSTLDKSTPKELLEELVCKLERGELKDLPAFEKKQLANFLMGEQVRLYRKSGWILGVRSNDISVDFLKYVAKHELKKPDDLAWARNTVNSYERDLTKWEQIAALVDNWRAFVEIEQNSQYKGSDAKAAHLYATSEMFRRLMEA